MSRGQRDSSLETHHLVALPNTGQAGCPQLGPLRRLLVPAPSTGSSPLPDETGMIQASLVSRNDFWGAPLHWVCRGQASPSLNSLPSKVPPHLLASSVAAGGVDRTNSAPVHLSASPKARGLPPDSICGSQNVSYSGES